MLHHVAAQVLACMMGSVDLGDPAKPLQGYVLHGDVAIDSCCPSGMLWVRITSATPTPTNQGRPCPATIDLGVEVGLVRCAPTPSSTGKPPPLEVQQDYAERAYADADMLLSAAQRCLDEHDLEWEGGAVGALSSTGPLGGCGGWTLGMTVTVPLC